jgi:hypothetical protein
VNQWHQEWLVSDIIFRAGHPENSVGHRFFAGFRGIRITPVSDTMKPVSDTSWLPPSTAPNAID